MSTTVTFDLDSFTRAAEERDAATQLSMYGPDAVVTIADKISQPGSPRVLRTHEDIKSWLEDMYGRDMTHTVKHRVEDETGAAYTQACLLPGRDQRAVRHRDRARRRRDRHADRGSGLGRGVIDVGHHPDHRPGQAR